MRKKDKKTIYGSWISPALHKAVLKAAKAEKRSISVFVRGVLEGALLKKRK